jgi:purine-binding chemotaxis protein CheW
MTMALPSLLSRTSRFAAREEAELTKQIVIFRIGKEEFGVDILMVQEIIRLPKITPIPNAPSFILGVLNLRGKVIPVIDLRHRLRIQGNQTGPDDKRTRILIIELDSHITGFIVDAVSEVMKVPVGEIEPTPHLVVSNIDAEYVMGVIKTANRLIILLDFGKILNKQEEKELGNIDLTSMESDIDREDAKLDGAFNISYDPQKVN